MPSTFISYFLVFFILDFFLSVLEILPSWPAYTDGGIVCQKYLSGLQFHIIFQKIFLVYTTYLEIPLLGIYSKDIACQVIIIY